MVYDYPVTVIKQEQIMSRGGKREGAGRLAKEPTTTVRVPMATAGAARQLAEAALAVAKTAMKQRHPSIDLSVEVLGVEIKHAEKPGVHTFYCYDGPMLKCAATDGVVREEFWISLDGEWFIA